MRQSFDLNAWLMDTYSLGDVTSELIRSYTNDVFLIRTRSERFVLKFYGLGWRTKSEIQYEVALLEHLSGKGLRVANIIPDPEGSRIHKITWPEGEQYAVLFEYAEGSKPQPPFSEPLYDVFGQAIGRMHDLSDDFVDRYDRKPLDIDTLIHAR